MKQPINATARRRWQLGALALGIVTLLSTGPAAGQDKSAAEKYSQVPIPVPANAQAELQQLLRDYQGSAAKKGQAIESLKGLNIDDLLKEPELRKLIEELKPNDLEGKVDPNLKEALKDKLKEVQDRIKKKEKPMGEGPPITGGPDDPETPIDKNPKPDPDKSPHPSDPGKMDPFDPPPEMPAEIIPEPVRPTGEPEFASKWLDKFLESSAGKKLFDSPELRKLILERNWFKENQPQGKFLGGNLPDMSKFLEKMPRLDWKSPFPGASGLNFGGVRLPILPQPRLPGLGALGAPNMTGSASLSTGSIVITVAILIGVVVILALMVRGARATAVAAPWRPGPWPVDPARISTRGELVRAFDHLALLLLGQRATHLNHRDIAGEVAAEPVADGERRRAAETLATMYEQARYAPAAETLAPEAVQQARRDLCSLAGVATA